MKTIRTKLFLLFAIFMVLLVLCGILLNALFLQKYYIYKNKNIFVETGKRIDDEFINNRNNIEYYINQIDRLEGISCTIADRNSNAIFNSFPEKSGRDPARLPGEIEQLIRDNDEKLFNGNIYTVVEKNNDQAPKLVFVSRMGSGDLIILRKPMKGIQESVEIANQFYFFAGFVIILMGGIFIFIFSGKITKPIIEMSDVAEDISNMDFTKKVKISSQDEIGSLGRSINQISDNLSSSINKLLEDVDRRKALVRNLSHELKTPIGVIKGYAEGLKFGVANDKEKADKYCTVIVSECDRMDRMIRELLYVSMFETGMFNLNIIRFDLCELVKNVADKFSHLINEKGIQLDLSLETNITVNADKELIERVLTNFLTNAIHHVGGEKIIKIKLQKISDSVRISVFNTGSHVPEMDLSNIWDVFYKVDKARSRQYGGHGLGLSIVKMIAEAHNGSCGVENVSDGVCFYFLISQKFHNMDIL